MKKKVALVSVFHKEGIVEFSKALIEMGWSILASGGTARVLAAAGLEVTDVAQLVGGGAILGHRVVTLSREVHAGLLATNSPEDIAEMDGLSIPFIDLVCVDLYPLIAEINREGSTPDSVIQQTDIGGPTMLRSGAKGQRIVVCDPVDRMRVVQWLRDGKPDEQSFIKALAAKAEYVISNYCLASAVYHSDGRYQGFIGELVAMCKYGENKYQSPAAFFSSATADSLAIDKFITIVGELSFNNYVDLDRLLHAMTRVAANFYRNFQDVPLIAIGVKHGNACGAAFGVSEIDVIGKMVEGDPMALFGGLVMTNFPIGEEEANLLLTHGVEKGRRILDGIIAPDFTQEAISALQRKEDRCRFVKNPALADLSDDSLDQAQQIRPVRGGFLRQPGYSCLLDLKDERLKRYINSGECDENLDMLLAHAICQTSNSNTITLVKDNMLIGNGVGQQSRVAGSNLAVWRAQECGHDTRGAVAASDSFFPFTDGVEVLVDAGIESIITTSGSVNDQKTIDLCIRRGIALYMLPDDVGRGFFNH